MNPLSKLPVLAVLGGAVLGSAVFLAVRAAGPLLTESTTGALSPWQAMGRLLLLVPIVAGLGGAAMAWLASHLSDWSESGRWLSAIVLGATTGAVAAGLGAAFLPEPPKELLMILAFSGPGALVGCTICSWVTDSSSAHFC